MTSDNPVHTPSDLRQGEPFRPVPAEARSRRSGLPPDWLLWTRQGLRASAGWPVRALPVEVSAGTMAALWAFSSLASVALERLRWPDGASFSLSGWLYGWSSLALLIAVVWFGMVSARASHRHLSPVAAWLVLYAVAVVPMSAAAHLWQGLLVRELLPGWASLPTVGWSVFGVLMAWLVVATARISLALLRNRLAAAALVLGVVAVQVVAIFWMSAPAWREERSSQDAPPILELSQEVFETQEALLERALGQLTRGDHATVQVFGLVYAPYAQDVFLRESRMVSAVLEQRMGHAGSVVTLLNHARTAQEQPWATPRNLKRTIDRLAEVMDRERDVLVLYLTSHGGSDHHLASSHWPLTVPSLNAEQVRQWLDAAGVKYRAIVVSACYSGGWIEPLASADGLVMTAAAYDKTSYGCGDDSDLTFFGKALFDEELRSTLSFEHAFEAARPRIHEREKQAGKPDGPSDPQIRVGAAFREHWTEWMNSRPTAQSSKP